MSEPTPTTIPNPPALPFGKHKDQPLGTVPTSYLVWLLTGAVKLSSGLRAAVAAELRGRGVTAPAPTPPAGPTCRTCPGAEVHCYWGECSNGRKFIRGECSRCGRGVGHMPLCPPFTDRADFEASPVPLLAVLTRAEELGVELRSDGQTVEFATGEDWRRADPELRATLRQCRHTLAKMMGKRPGGRR